MGLISKIVILSACVALTFAQDYEYSINADKVSVRQGPNVANQFQQQPSFQSGSPRAPPRQTAQFAKFQSIPQVNPQQAQEPQQFDAPPPRILLKPAQFRQGAASTYIPAQSNSFQPAAAPVQNFRTVPAPVQNFRPVPAPVQNFRPAPAAPVQSEQSYTDEQSFAPAPLQQFQPEENFQAQPEQNSFEQPQISNKGLKHAVKGHVLRRPSTSTLPPKAQSAEDLAIIQEQNAGAQYSFSSNVQNSIQDNSLQREEVRDGLAVKGMYSYSDGFYKRTVQYEADENGYRVVGESNEPIGNLEGPQLNLNGNAQVNTDIQGTGVGYSITADDVVDLRKLKNKQQSNLRVLA